MQGIQRAQQPKGLIKCIWMIIFNNIMKHGGLEMCIFWKTQNFIEHLECLYLILTIWKNGISFHFILKNVMDLSPLAWRQCEKWKEQFIKYDWLRWSQRTLTIPYHTCGHHDPTFLSSLRYQALIKPRSFRFSIIWRLSLKVLILTVGCAQMMGMTQWYMENNQFKSSTPYGAPNLLNDEFPLPYFDAY